VKIEKANTGIMICFYPTIQVARQLALPDGEPPEELHCTLAYLGDIREGQVRHPEVLVRELHDFASFGKPIIGRINGIGRFSNSKGPGEKEPVVALYDAPFLPEFRQMLMTFLTEGRWTVNQEHGFIPHLTLKYIFPEDPLPVQRLPDDPLTFTKLSLVWAGQRYDIALGLTGAIKFPWS
jgi:2'-5' RNA ligase